MKTILLLGAGAAIPWGGMKSDELTVLLNKDTDFIVNESESLAGYLYSHIVEFYRNKIWVNFETIIDALETIFDYYSHKSHTGAGPNYIRHFPIWFKENQITQEIFGRNYHEFLNIKEGSFSKGSEKEYYLSEAIKKYIQIICDSVSHYDNNNSEEEYSNLNDKLSEFYSLLEEKHNPVRTYTTNYDNLVPDIVYRLKGFSFFNGFIDSNEAQSIDEALADINKIIFDSECRTYYNLHGSVYWIYKFNL